MKSDSDTEHAHAGAGHHGSDEGFDAAARALAPEILTPSHRSAPSVQCRLALATGADLESGAS